VVKIGVLNDMSGVYSDDQGPGSVLAAQMAVEDFGGSVGGRKVEGHLRRPPEQDDIGAQIARGWLDNEGVGMIVDLPNSAIALAVATSRATATSDDRLGRRQLGDHRREVLVQHRPLDYDTWAYGPRARPRRHPAGRQERCSSSPPTTPSATISRRNSATRRSSRAQRSSARPPSDRQQRLSSLLLQAQSSGADAVAFANAGGDTTNSLKQAGEFGLAKKQKLLALIMGQNNVRALGVAARRGPC